MRKSRSGRSPVLHVALITAASALLIVVFGLLYFKIRIENWLRGEEFRNLVSIKTSEFLGVDARFDRIQWEGSGAYSERFAGTGSRPGAPDKLTALRIRSDLNWRRIFDGYWSLGEIRIGYLEARFLREQRPPAPSNPPPDAAASTASVPSTTEGLLPARFESGPVIVEKADLSFGEISLNSTAIESRAEGAGWLMDFKGGALSAPGLPDFSLNSARVRVAKDGVYLVDSTAVTPPSGTLRASGFFTRQAAQPSRLDLEWNSVEVRQILPGDWRPYLSGILDGNATIQFFAGGADSPTITGSAAVRDGTLQGLGILEALSKFSDSPRFLRLPLHELSAEFSVIRGATNVRSLVLESRGLLRVEGELDISTDQSLGGTLEVGLTPQTLQWLPGARSQVFSTSRDGYLWTSVRVGGTLQNPTEDLSRRLLVAAGSELIETGTRILENPADAATEGIRKTMELLPGLFP